VGTACTQCRRTDCASDRADLVQGFSAFHQGDHPPHPLGRCDVVQLALEFDAAEFCSEAYCREHWPGVAITVVPRA